MAVILTLVDREIITLDPIIMEWIKLESSSGTVVISAAQHRHIIERRQISSQFDADISANRLAEALGNIKYKLRSQARPYFWEVIGFANSAGRYVRVVLKLVPGDRSRSGADRSHYASWYDGSRGCASRSPVVTDADVSTGGLLQRRDSRELASGEQ